MYQKDEIDVHAEGKDSLIISKWDWLSFFEHFRFRNEKVFKTTDSNKVTEPNIYIRTAIDTGFIRDME
jgi:hypothetical protein